MGDRKPADPTYRTVGPTIVQDDVNEILRQKRKPRGQRACYPCRQRKVKCDYRTPCQTCADRHHPELCAYEPPSKRVDTGSSHPHRTTSSSAPIKHTPIDNDKLLEKFERLEHSIQELRQDVRFLTAGGTSLPAPSGAGSSSSTKDVEDEDDVYARNDFTGEAVHLGAHSVLATVAALGKDSNKAVMQSFSGNSTLPFFGLDNQSATYPFIDLWVMSHGSLPRIQELCKLLPTDADCLQYFRQYRDTAHALYPCVVDIAEFEADLMVFLIRRAGSVHGVGSDEISEQSVYGATLHWVGLLFAILSSGCQWSAAPGKERQLTSQVYGGCFLSNWPYLGSDVNSVTVSCAYDCLRIINYLSNTTLVDIQTLLVLGNVISNSMNAGVAWSFLGKWHKIGQIADNIHPCYRTYSNDFIGLTIRLAQSLGLHRPSPPSTPLATQSLREETWWRVVWQDSLLSVTFDRASLTPTIKHHRAEQTSLDQRMIYTDCMKSICQVGLDIVRERSNEQSQQRKLAYITGHRKELDNVMKAATDHLKDIQACRSMKDQLEHWNLFLHRSYITSELYRPFLRNHGDRDFDLMENFRTCVESLADTVDAFLGLENITRFAHQSWAAVHRALSSGLLLGIVKEHLKSERVQTLLERLIVVMSSLASGRDNSEMAAPIRRSVSALSSLISLHHGQWTSASDTPQTHWGSEISTLLDESSLPAKSDANSPKENSPYSLINRILWGPQHTPSV